MSKVELSEGFVCEKLSLDIPNKKDTDGCLGHQSARGVIAASPLTYRKLSATGVEAKVIFESGKSSGRDVVPIGRQY